MVNIVYHYLTNISSASNAGSLFESYDTNYTSKEVDSSSYGESLRNGLIFDAIELSFNEDSILACLSLIDAFPNYKELIYPSVNGKWSETYDLYNLDNKPDDLSEFKESIKTKVDEVLKNNEAINFLSNNGMLTKFINANSFEEKAAILLVTLCLYTKKL